MATRARSPAQTRPEHEVAQKSTVTLRVFTGDSSNSIDMPDVRRDPQAQAQATLAAAGFSNVQLQRVPTDNPAEDGQVVRQSPSPRKSVSTDDEVTLFIGDFSRSGSSSETTGGG